LPLGKLHIWEVATWENIQLGSCHLGIYPIEKLPLGKIRNWEVATWEKPSGKVSNTQINDSIHGRTSGKYFNPRV